MRGWRRPVVRFCGAALLALAGWTIAGLVGSDDRPAAAAPLTTICDAAGGSLRAVPSSLVFDGNAISGQHHSRTGFPAAAIARTPDPDGSPSIAQGNLQPVDLDGDGRLDLELALGLRASTAAETTGSVTGATPMDALLTQNDGYRPDSAPSGVGVGVTGLDLLVKVPATSWINKTGHYAARVQVRLERVLGGRVVDHLDVTFTIDSLQAAARAATARFPGEVRMSVALRDPEDDLAAWVVGHEVVYPGVAPDDHGPLDLGTTVTRVVPAPDGPTFASGLVDVDLAWNRVPVDAAFGVRQTCLPGSENRGPGPVAHYASNLPDPAPSGHDVDMAVRSGLGSGLDGGDEVRIEGKVRQLPRLVDVLGRADVVDLVHSPEVAPDVRLDRLDLGVDDGDTGADEPLHAHGRLDGLPPHVRIARTRDAADDIAVTDVDACPSVGATDGALPYLPVHAPTLAATGRADGCSAPAGAPPVTIPAAHLVVQNFLPDGPYGREPSAELEPAPPPARPSEREAHYEQPVAGEDWRLVEVVRLAVARTTFVVAAAQHPHVGAAIEKDVLLVRVGADLTEVESLSFTTEAGTRRPAGTDPGPDDRATYGARDEVGATTRAAPELRARVTLQSDRRDDLDDDQDNAGGSASVRGTLTPFPGVLPELAVQALGPGTVDNRTTSALRARWQAPQATLDLDVVHHQSPGRDDGGRAVPSVVVDGEAELAAPASGEVELAGDTGDGRLRTALFSRTAAGDELELRLAGRITTTDDRRDGRALLFATTARVIDKLRIALERGLDDRALTEAAAVACTGVAGCDSDVQLDAVMGPDTSVPTLASGVTPPAPVPPRSWVTPAPAEANDVTVVRAPVAGSGPDEGWAASLDLHDLVGLSYRPDPGDVCLRTGDGPRQPLTALLQTPEAWFDGRLDAAPDSAEAKLRFDPQATDEPMLWTDIASCSTGEAPVDETAPGYPWEDQDIPRDDEDPEPQPPGPPVLEATVVVGSGSPEPVSALEEPQLAPAGDGLAVTAERTLDRTTASAVRLREWLPEHLLIWAPDTGCPFDCASPGWQRREHSGVRVRAQSTRADLGALTVTADVARRAGSCRSIDSRWAVRTDVPHVPGNFDVQASLRTTARLCALDAEIDARGSTPIGELATTATDLGQPTDLAQRRTGYQGDAVGGQRTAVPELSLALRGVADELHFTSRQRGFETPDARPAPSGDLCPGHPAVSRGPINVGYIDAAIDLSSARGDGTPARNVVLDVVQAPTDPRGTADARSLITVNSGRPVDAVVQTRLNNLAQSIAFTRSDPIPRGLGILFPPLAGALVPGSAGAATPLALAADALADDTELDACIDFDLPLVLTLTHTTTAQLARAGVSFALDDDGATGTLAALDVGEVLTSASGNPTLREGAPFAYRSVDYDSGSTTTSSGVVTNAWKDVVAAPAGGALVGPLLACDGGTGPSIRYFPGIPTTGGALDTTATFTRASIGTATVRDGTTTGVTLRRAEFELDLLWDFLQRGDLVTMDLAGDDDCPGVRLYNGLGALATPPTSLPVAITATPTPVQEAEYTITQADALAAGPTFCSLGGWSSAAENRPVAGTQPDYPVAVGADGTRYSLEVWTQDPNQTYCRINLVARHPGGALRWTRRIADNAGPIGAWPLDWTVRILPRADDGSVELQLRQFDRRQGVPLTRGKIWLQVFDASGNGEVILGEHPDLGAVLGLLTGVVPDLRLDVPQLPAGVGCVTFASPAPAPAGTTRVWWFGDGARHVDPPDTDDAADVEHCYGHIGDYYVQAVDFRQVTTSGGHTRTEIAGSLRFRIHVVGT